MVGKRLAGLYRDSTYNTVSAYVGASQTGSVRRRVHPCVPEHVKLAKDLHKSKQPQVSLGFDTYTSPRRILTDSVKKRILTDIRLSIIISPFFR